MLEKCEFFSFNFIYLFQKKYYKALMEYKGKNNNKEKKF